MLYSSRGPDIFEAQGLQNASSTMPSRTTPLIQCPVDFFEFLLSTEFAACSRPPGRDNHRKASYPKTQQRDQGAD